MVQGDREEECCPAGIVALEEGRGRPVCQTLLAAWTTRQRAPNAMPCSKNAASHAHFGRHDMANGTLKGTFNFGVIDCC